MALISVFRSLKHTGTAAAFEVLSLGESGGNIVICFNFRYSERFRRVCASLQGHLFFLHQALDRNEPKEVQAIAVQKKNDKDQQEAVHLGAFPVVLRSGNCTKERMRAPVRSGTCTYSKLHSYTHTPSPNPLHTSL